MNKTALITGGTSGVGLSMVKFLLEKEYQVSFIGSNKEKGAAVEATLNETYAGRATFIQLDLSLVKEVKSFARGFVQAHDKLDLLANIAGALLPKKSLTAEGNEQSFAVGYLSTAVLSMELLPLLENVQGRIINVTGMPSVVFKTKLEFTDLNFSKKYNGMNAGSAALHAKAVLAEILSEKYKIKGVTVNAFFPGVVQSDLAQHQPVFIRFLFKLFSVFMAKDSKTGFYVSTSPDIRGVTGKFFNKKKQMDLNFGQEYKQQLWNATEKLVSTI